MFKNKFLVFIFLLISTELLFLNLPLLSSYGYEFSFANGIILFFVGGYFVILQSKNNLFHSSFDLFLEKFHLLTLIFLIPLILGISNLIFFEKCPVSTGLKFYFSITFFSYLFGLMLGLIIVKSEVKRSLLFFNVTSILILLSAFYEFYFFPQVYSFNPIYGLINGTIYDEEVNLDWKLLLFQFYNLFLFLLIHISLIILNKKGIKKSAKFLFIISILFISFYIKPYFGFSTNQQRIERYLPSKIETNHFIIFTDKGISIKDRFILALLHEYYFEQVEQKLEEKYPEKIISYIFKDRNQKGYLFGAVRAEVAKPWLGQIFVSYESIEKTLKHEIAHVVASNFGRTIFKISKNANPALTEGLAMFVENNFDNYDLDYVAFLYLSSKKPLELEKLFENISFFSSYSSIGYVLTGSFLKFLIENYGLKRVKDLYYNANFELVFNKSIGELEKEYLKYLNNKNYIENKYKAQLYFGGKPIVSKICPRHVAIEIKKANELFNNKKYEEASGLYLKIFSYSKNYNSLVGLINSKIKLNDYKSALNILLTEINNFKEQHNYFNLELLLSDVYLFNNEIDKSVEVLDSIINQNPNYNYVYEAKLKKLLLKFFSKDAINFYLKNENEQFEIIQNLFLKTKESFFIKKIISFVQSDKNYNYNIFDKIELNGSTIENYYTLLSLSKYYFKQMNFVKSQSYAAEAAKCNIPEEEKYRAIEFLRMVNWFVNYSSEIKIKEN